MTTENIDSLNTDDIVAGFGIDYMRKEVQKIIDNHLKDDDKWFSVMDRSYEKLNVLIDLLTGRTTREDLEARREQNEKQLRMNYELILCENDLINSLKKLARDTRDELSSLKSDLSLEADLNKLDLV